MSRSSQHPEIEVAPDLRDTVERVRSGIEPVIILTDVDGEPLAALVSLDALKLLDDRALALRSEAEMEMHDCEGLHSRQS